ncbi:MAG: hypothetical protein HC905_02430 [Bacteroidales bacterium]|nr:hypothetical protein [Bacteroidales bacterium]
MNIQEDEIFVPKSRQDWRKWLEENHQFKSAVWLIYYKNKTNKPTVKYNEAVDEALCYGWIDSKTKSLDDEKFMQFFSKRKPKSVWSKVNKENIQRLIDCGLMTVEGFKSIEIAKQNGSWTILDTAESLIIPNDLESELKKNTNALEYFHSLSRSDKRNILQWLVLAKRNETRLKRIEEIVYFAGLAQKPKQFR